MILNKNFTYLKYEKEKMHAHCYSKLIGKLMKENSSWIYKTL